MPSTVVHQALHGYSDGHRLISSSLSLPSSDARTMLVMSDLSGPGVKPRRDGYLTGYPLEGAGKYVLARTWAAPEMPRPGCVWTHSLIIDNADLATMASASKLLSEFRRPEPATLRSGYASPVAVPTRPDVLASARPGKRAYALLNALYAAPDRVVVTEAEDAEDDEQLATAIWMQQWPRLRRAFGFCTLTGVDRSTKAGSLDLQLIPGAERQYLSKFPGAVTPAEVVFEPTLKPLFEDISNPGGSQIREFLRRIGGDVDGGRRAMVPLCGLYLSIFERRPPDLSAAVRAFSWLDGLGRRQARTVRTLVARQAISNVENVDDEVFDFLMDTFELDSSLVDQPVLRKRFGAALWRRSPARFAQAMMDGGVVGRAASEAIEGIAADELVAGLEQHTRIAAQIIANRPDLLERGDFWRIPNIDDDLANNVSEAAAAKVAGGLLEAGRTTTAQIVIERADPGDLAEAFESKAANGPALAVWLQVLARNASKVAAVLASGRVRRLSTVLALARAMEPDRLPNETGEDPWLVAVESASGSLSQADRDYLSAFLMSRALGDSSRSPAALIRYAYFQVYRALQENRLPSDVERLVTWRLDWGSWFDWDKCSRLNHTVVDRFVNGRLDPEAFGRLTDDGPMARALIDEAARTSRGRRYLGEVRKRLKHAGEKGIRARADYIAEKIN